MERVTGRATALFCYASALVAIVYAAASDEGWPLPFATVMIVSGLIFGIGELLGGGRG